METWASSNATNKTKKIWNCFLLLPSFGLCFVLEVTWVHTHYGISVTKQPKNSSQSTSSLNLRHLPTKERKKKKMGWVRKTWPNIRLNNQTDIIGRVSTSEQGDRGFESTFGSNQRHGSMPDMPVKVDARYIIKAKIGVEDCLSKVADLLWFDGNNFKGRWLQNIWMQLRWVFL